MVDLDSFHQMRRVVGIFKLIEEKKLPVHIDADLLLKTTGQKNAISLTETIDLPPQSEVLTCKSHVYLASKEPPFHVESKSKLFRDCKIQNAIVNT